jgi:prepilin-type N-terminal cleavage/methylation domain-containing protein
VSPLSARSSNANQRGFTLLEILVSVAILGVALVSLLGLHARNIKLFSEAQDVTVAGLLASRMAAETQALGFPPIGSETGTFVSLDSSPSTGFGERTGGNLATGYTWRRDIEATGIENLRRVTVGIFLGEPLDDVAAIVQFDFLVRKGGPP